MNTPSLTAATDAAYAFLDDIAVEGPLLLHIVGSAIQVVERSGIVGGDNKLQAALQRIEVFANSDLPHVMEEAEAFLAALIPLINSLVAIYNLAKLWL